MRRRRLCCWVSGRLGEIYCAGVGRPRRAALRCRARAMLCRVHVRAVPFSNPSSPHSPPLPKKMPQTATPTSAPRSTRGLSTTSPRGPTACRGGCSSTSSSARRGRYALRALRLMALARECVCSCARACAFGVVVWGCFVVVCARAQKHACPHHPTTTFHPLNCPPNTLSDVPSASAEAGGCLPQTPRHAAFAAPPSPARGRRWACPSCRPPTPS